MSVPTVPAAPTERFPTAPLHTLEGHEGAVLALAFNGTGTYCLSCGKDRTLRLWNPHRGTLIKTYTGHGYDVRDVAVSSNNGQLATGGGDRNIFLFDTATGKIIRKFRGHDSTVNSVAFGPGDGTIVSAGYDQTVSVWDCRSRSFDPVQAMKTFADSVTRALITSSEEIVASSVDGTVQRFDIRGGCLYADALGSPVSSIALSHDQNCILAACLDNCVRLLDKATGELLAQYSGHKNESTRVDCGFTPSDAYVLAASEDGRICFWDLVEEGLVQSLQAHKEVVTAMALHPAATCLATASTDGLIQIWS